MDVIPLFPSILIKFNVPVPKTLVEYCLEQEKKSDGVSRSNAGGWQSDNTINFDQYFYKTYFENFLDQVSCKVDVPNLQVTSAWININRKGNYNRIHTHPGNDLAMVWYIKFPDNSGGITFEHPTLHTDFKIFESFNKTITDPHYCVANCTLYPEVGDCYIFPASLRHYVEENQSDEERITIAMNLKIVSPFEVS